MSREKVRLYQLSRELGVDSKDLLDLLKAAGADVKTHMTALDAETRQLAEDLVSGKVTVGSAKASRSAASSAAAAGPIPPPRSQRLREIPKPLTAADDETAVPEEVEDAPTVPQPPPVPSIAAAIQSATPPAPPVVVASKQLGQIPPPTSARPTAIPPPRASEPAEIRQLRPLREPRPARPRSVATSLAPAPKPLSAELPRKAQPLAGAQKPVRKFSPEAIRDGKVTIPEAQEGRPPTKEVLTADFEDEESKSLRKARGGGALAGREERQRRRGQRAAERRFELPSEDEDGESTRRGTRIRARRIATPTMRERGAVALEIPVTVRSFSEAAGVRANEVIRKLIGLGIMATINESLPQEQVELLGIELGLEVHIKRPKDAEMWLEESLHVEQEDAEKQLPRPPVVTFMGHVDHGKTSLMDRIRSANVVATESGGITQHIGAYQVHSDSGTSITFLDTPGHEAFTALRARGANVTDVVVLVVAADDGVMPQTEEAISHAKAAEVPIVVAMNKIDLPGANTDRLMQQLSTHGLIPEAWGGDTLMIGTSAVTGGGINDLLQAIAVVAELRELKANAQRPAYGTCLEASLSEGRGAQPTMLVRQGTLHRGDLLVCGTSFGRVRAMFDDQNRPIDEALPSAPVVVIGLDEVPEPGEQFVVVDDVSRARDLVEERRSKARIAARFVRQHVTLDRFYDTLQERKIKELLLILKADVRGSLEAIRKELGGLDHAEVRVRVIHDGVGGITESDVLLADASDAIIIGFRVVPEDRAQVLASDKGVEIRRYDIIYQVSDDIKKALEGLLTPESREVQLGRAVVQETFSISRVGTIAGCRVVSGTIERNSRARVVRDGTVVGAYPIESLRRIKDDVREVREGLECGIRLAGFNDVKRGDLLETFKIEEIRRTL